MDLEHTNLGNHCEVSDCKQRDFLPFTCDVCHKKLCLAHRTYAAHSCNGADTKDMTSIDCPMCGISVKFPKSQQADSVWTEHYLSNCTQKLKKKVTIHCYEKSCQLLLGPSNDYVCAKCKQHVCLSHRVPEDHHCLGMRGAYFCRPSLHPMSSSSGNSANVAALKSQGDKHYQTKNYHGAINAYSSAIDMAGSEDPLLGTLYSNRCACFLNLNKANEALEDAQSCTQLMPTWAKAFARLGSCHLKLNRKEDAIRAYERAVSLEPSNSEYTRALAAAQNYSSFGSGFSSFDPSNLASSFSNMFGGGGGGTGGGRSRSHAAGGNATAAIIENVKRVLTGLVSKATAWWVSMDERSRNYLILSVVGLIVYFYFFRSSSSSYGGYSDYGSGYYGGGGLSWTTWAGIMYAAYKLPPMFPDMLGQYARPFFGMSWTTFMWLLDMLTRQRGGGFNRYGRRRGFY